MIGDWLKRRKATYCYGYNWTVTGSCGLVELDQSQVGASFWGELGAEEFLEFIALGQRQERIGEGVAKSVSDDQLGRREGTVFGAQPTAKEAPHGAVMEDRQVLEYPLDDEADLDVPLIGGELAADLSAVTIRLAVEVLVAVAAADRCHGPHPEVVGIGADGMDRLFEADFDFEAPAVETNDRQGVEGGVGAQEDESAAGGVIDQDEADQATQGSPQQVQGAVTQGEAALAVDGAGGGDEALVGAEELAELELAAIALRAAAAAGGAGGDRLIGGGGGAQPGDQMVAL